MIAIRRTSNSSYESGDVIAFVEDDHVFSPKDLPAGQREAVNVGNLTDEERSLLEMSDERFVNIAAMRQIPIFRTYLFKRERVKAVRRRKYKLDSNNKPKQKGFLDG